MERVDAGFVAVHRDRSVDRPGVISRSRRLSVKGIILQGEEIR